jgi:GNAT superfamily N-acetyltransferase
VNQTQVMRNGVVVRPAGERDTDDLAAMLAGLSDLALYFRFQTAVGRPPRPGLVDQLLQPAGAAWVAERGQVIVGHAMWAWAKGSSSPTAELAVVVDESEQRRGLGVQLISRAAADAYAAGATEFLMVVSAANDKVIRLIRRHWPAAQVERDGALLNYVVPATAPWSSTKPALPAAAFV